MNCDDDNTLSWDFPYSQGREKKYQLSPPGGDISSSSLMSQSKEEEKNPVSSLFILHVNQGLTQVTELK